MVRSVDMSTACADELPGGHCLRLEGNSSALCADLELLAQAADSSIQVRQFLLDFADSGTQFVGVDREVFATPAANGFWVQFELADGLRGLVAAVRAGRVDQFFVQQSSHGQPSQKAVDCGK